MGRDVGFEDLKDVSPDVYSSLKKLLAYEGDVSELGLIFQVCSAPFYISFDSHRHLLESIA